jgi:hypothetical protein
VETLYFVAVDACPLGLGEAARLGTTPGGNWPSPSTCRMMAAMRRFEGSVRVGRRRCGALREVSLWGIQKYFRQYPSASHWQHARPRSSACRQRAAAGRVCRLHHDPIRAEIEANNAKAKELSDGQGLKTLWRSAEIVSSRQEPPRTASGGKSKADRAAGLCSQKSGAVVAAFEWTCGQGLEISSRLRGSKLGS